MCYEDIRDMDPHRQSVGDVVAQTAPSAFNTAALAAAFVVAALLLRGVAVTALLTNTATAFLLGGVVYVALVAALAGLVRTRERTGLPVPSPSRHH